MPARSSIYIILGVCLVAATRILFRSHLLYDIDSVNFALAIRHFNPVTYQPHPPGYFLYVCLGRLVNLLVPDDNNALVAISVVASCGAAWMIHMLAQEWFGDQAALMALGIFLISPLCWFHGIVALTYIVEAFFSALTGYLCWRAYSGTSVYLWPAAVVLGIAAGFRPSSLLFLGPIWLIAWWRASGRMRVLAASLLSLTLLAWWIPMIEASGGARVYFDALLGLWRLVPAKQSFETSYLAMVLARAITVAGIAALCFGSAALLIFQRSPVADPPAHDRRVFTVLWLGPGLLFFIFVFLNFVNSGYLLVLSPPVFAWLGLRASVWWGQDRGRRRLKIAFMGAAAAVNVCVFLFAPFYCSFREVRRLEAALTENVAALRKSFNPQEALIVGFDSHFLGYRHAAYYLPEFMTVQYPAVSLPGGKKIFAVEHRETLLLSAVPTRHFRQFVLFPLPAEAGYRDYLAKQTARFPAGTLRSAGQLTTFTVGGIADLPYLFPGSGSDN